MEFLEFTGYRGMAGQTRYVAWKNDTVVQMAGMLGGYTPKRDKWVGKQVNLRLRDENWMGLKTPVAAFKTPEGKEWKLVIVSIVGPDGVDECPPAFGFKQNLGHCKPQQPIDRPKREAEILAKLQAQGKVPVWESAEGAAFAPAVRTESRGATIDIASAVAAPPASEPGTTSSGADTADAPPSAVGPSTDPSTDTSATALVPAGT